MTRLLVNVEERGLRLEALPEGLRSSTTETRRRGCAGRTSPVTEIARRATRTNPLTLVAARGCVCVTAGSVNDRACEKSPTFATASSAAATRQ